MREIVLSFGIVLFGALVIVQQHELHQWRDLAQRTDKQTVDCLAANSSLKTSFDSLEGSFDRCMQAVGSLKDSSNKCTEGLNKCSKELNHLADHVLQVLPGKESKIQ